MVNRASRPVLDCIRQAERFMQLNSRRFIAILALITLGLCGPVMAGTPAPEGPPVSEPPKHYLFTVTLHTKTEIDALLTRAETLSRTMRRAKNGEAGIALVLHGPEIRLFDRRRYKGNKGLVDLAARLKAEGIMQIKVCKKTLGDLKMKIEDLPGFIEIVPYAPDEERRLRDKGYVYF